MAKKKAARLAPKVSKSRPKTPPSSSSRKSPLRPETTKPAPVAYRISVGDRAPAFRNSSTAGAEVGSRSFAGRPLVIYFYPKDNTPGCTLEGQDFRRLYAQFKKAGAEIVGVSKDSLNSHEGFRKKCDFPFQLLADEDGATCAAFDVIQIKSLYGRKFLGIERSTFLIDAQGKLAAVWRKVRVAGHADEVLKAVKGLSEK